MLIFATRMKVFLFNIIIFTTMTLKFSVTLKPVVNSNGAEKKYYPTLQSTEKNIMDALVAHITGHNSKFNKADLEGVVTELLACMKEMLMDGTIVQLGEDFGSFRLSIHSAGMTAEEMVENNGYFDTSLISGVNVIWSRGKAFRGLRPSDFSFTEVTTKREQGEELATKRAIRAGKEVDTADKDTEPGAQTGDGDDSGDRN